MNQLSRVQSSHMRNLPPQPVNKAELRETMRNDLLNACKTEGKAIEVLLDAVENEERFREDIAEILIELVLKNCDHAGQLMREAIERLADGVADDCHTTEDADQARASLYD